MTASPQAPAPSPGASSNVTLLESVADALCKRRPERRGAFLTAIVSLCLEEVRQQAVSPRERQPDHVPGETFDARADRWAVPALCADPRCAGCRDAALDGPAPGGPLGEEVSW